MTERTKAQRLVSAVLFVFVVFLLLFAVTSAHAQDNFVPQCATQASCKLNQFGPISWANGNQVWRFIPINPNVSFRIWIRNNNTTTGHTSQTIHIFVTDETTVPNFLLSQDHWVEATVIDNPNVGAGCNNLAINNPAANPGGKGTCYSNSMYAAQIAIQITGAAAAAGSPDTFDIGVVQQSGIASGPRPGGDSTSGGYNAKNRWRIIAAGTAGAAITATQPAVAGVTHVADCVSFTVFALAAPGAASGDTLRILDGAAAIWSVDVVVPASIGTFATINFCGLNIPASVGATMSCNATNATANAAHSCALVGYDR